MNDDTRPPTGLREHLETVFRHRGKIVTVFVTTALVATAGSFLHSNVYEASARVLVQHRRPQAAVGAALTAPDSTAVMTERDPVPTEVQIFLGPAVLEGAAEKLGLQTVLERMRWRWDWLRELPLKAYATVMTWFVGTPAEPPLRRNAAERIEDHLQVEPVRDSDVFTVSFQAPDPDFAALVVNTLVDQYLDHHLAVRQGVVSTSVFGEEAQRLTQDLREAETRVQSFKQAHGIVSAAEQKQLLLRQLSGTEVALRRAEREALEADRRIAELRRQVAAQAATIPQSTSTTRNPVLRALDRQLAQLELERAQYVAGSPAARQLEQEIAAVRSRIQSESSKLTGTQVSGVNQIHVELQTSLALEEGRRRGFGSQDQLREQAEQYRRAVAELDRREQELRELVRAAELKEEALRLYLKKQEEARLSGMLDRKRISNVTPLAQAEPPLRHARPRRMLIIVAGLLVGSFGGIAVAYLAEYLRRSFASGEEAARRLGQPVIAALVDDHMPGSGAQNVIEARRMSEAVWQAHRGDGVRSVLVVSVVSGEGKTRCVNALGNGLAHMGLHVLAIDTRVAPDAPADATPAPASIAGLLTEGGHARLKRLRLSDLPAPADMQSAVEQLRGLSPRLREQFDLVLLDGPSVGAHPDGLWLASVADAVLLVVEAERTPALSAANTLRLIREAGGKSLGVVLNKRRFVIPPWVYHWLLTPETRPAES